MTSMTRKPWTAAAFLGRVTIDMQKGREQVVPCMSRFTSDS